MRLRAGDARMPRLLRGIRLHTSAYIRIRQHTSEYVSTRQHTSAYVGTHQQLA